MSALRCTKCNDNWPYTNAYAKCPRCGETTWLSNGSTAMTYSEACSIVNHIEFERYYAEHERQKEAEELKAKAAFVREMNERLGSFDLSDLGDLATSTVPV